MLSFFFCFGKGARAFKRKTDGVCFTELPASVLARTSKQTGLRHSGVNRLTNCVRLFRYFYWFPSKSTLKLDNRKLFCARHTRGRHEKNISNFVKASHTLMHLYPLNILAKFRENLTNSCENLRQFSHKNKPRDFSLERFSQFSHLIKATVIVFMPPTNETQHITP